MAEEKRRSNYEKTMTDMASVFLRYDQEAMIRRFGLAWDERSLFVTFVGRRYRVDRADGGVSWSEDGFRTETPAGHNEVMTLYDVLCHAGEAPALAGQWVNLNSLSPIRGGTLAKGTGFFEKAGAAFQGQGARLERACRALGGRRLEKGDVAYAIDLFPFLPLALRFWDADEDFPASLQIFTDKNILGYMRYETLMFAVTHVLERLEALGGADRPAPAITLERERRL